MTEVAGSAARDLPVAQPGPARAPGCPRFRWAERVGRQSPETGPRRVSRLFTSVLGLFLGLAVCDGSADVAPARVIYSTGFEVSEGYTPAENLVPLRGQQGWLGEGSGGNGLLTNFFEGSGQQAFIGFSAPAPKDEVLNIWRPLPVAAPAPGESILKFSVLMQVTDSTNGEYDDFRWSAYNTAAQRLFTLDFDNSRAEIFYALDDNAGYRPTGFTFSNDAIYELEVLMNFARNNWTARMNGVVVVDSQPLTTVNARLDLSDFDAVWALRKKGLPGDNYLLFDDYTISAEPGATIPPLLEIIGLNVASQFELILHGERGLKYSVDVSDDFANWSSLGTNRLDNGFWQLADTSSPGYPRSFYRAREVGP